MSRLKKKFQNREEGALEEYWTYFSGKNAQVSECLRCEEEVKEGGKPGSLAMNCWKLLAFPSTPEKLDSIKEYLSEYVKRFPLTQGKWSNQLSGGRYVVVWYFVSKKDMWRSRELITKEWVELGILPIEESYYLPYQRGGNYYEPMFGHWRTWGYKYYSNLKVSPDRVAIICPYCGAKLSLRSGKFGEFYGCSSYPECSFTFPKLIIYETLETGYAEYERRKDHKIFHVKMCNERVIVKEKKIKR